jgi:NADPH:quinone reductase-like Zn-dependent oxidoreductase
MGTEVTGVTSTRNVELVRSLGADYVIDYTKTDFSKTGTTYDLIFDTIGNIDIASAKRALQPEGLCVVAGFTTLRHLLALGIGGNLKSDKPGPKIGMMDTAEEKKEDLLIMRDLLASGKIKPVIDLRFPLHETAEAIRYLETGRARGKVMVSVA